LIRLQYYCYILLTVCPRDLTALFVESAEPGGKINTVIRLRRFVLALIYLITGTIFGLLFLEAILRCNPTLLQRGLALPFPVDHPLTIQTYDVRYSDADVFHWRPDLIRPVPEAADWLESHVIFETDEFGFRNSGPIPPDVDAVVLGRSISLAGHLAQPWPDLLAGRLNWQVFNLSQPGSGVQVKRSYLERFGLPRRPRWVIVEVVPSIDLLGDHTAPSSISRQMVVPVLQQLARRWLPNQPVAADRAIYPLPVDILGRTIDLTCCLHYLDFFSLDRQTLEQSRDWANYRTELLKIVDAARSNNTCVALLYAPTKPDVYFPIALDPNQLNPALRDILPFHLDPDGWVGPDPGGVLSIGDIRQNALVGRDLVKSFARENDLTWIDPNDALVQSILEGQDPFLVYDSHWNQLGHQIVAGVVAEALQEAACP
jgi:hypothetical protein